MISSATSSRILLTGDIQSGKSTLVRALLDRSGWEHVAGFYTRRLGELAAPKGFSLCAWQDRAERQFCWRETGATGQNGSRLDLSVFSEYAVSLLDAEAAPSYLVIDELGVMEQGIDVFEKALSGAIGRAACTWLVVQRRALAYWTRTLSLDSFQTFDVNTENRNAMREQLAGLHGIR